MSDQVEKKKGSWGIGELIANSGVELETFEVDVSGPTMEEMERQRREENDAEYARLMEIRRQLEENPDWMAKLEKEMRSDEDSNDDNEEEEEEGKEEDDEEKEDEEEQIPKKKKRRRRRKKKVESTTPIPSEEKEIQQQQKSPPPPPHQQHESKERKIVQKKKEKKKKAPVPNIQDPKCTIYVGNLSYDADVSSIKKGLSSLGSVDHVHVIKNNKGRGAGFAYVTFQDEKTAQNAIRSDTPISIDGRDIRVKAFDPESLYRRTGKRKAKRKRQDS